VERPHIESDGKIGYKIILNNKILLAAQNSLSSLLSKGNQM
jgi:hypothetical protein